MQKILKAGKAIGDALKKGIEKAKQYVAQALEKYLNLAKEELDNLREKFGDVNPDTLPIHRIGIPDNIKQDGGTYIKLKDCEATFKDDGWVYDVEFTRPYFECKPVGDVCSDWERQNSNFPCSSVDTNAAWLGGKRGFILKTYRGWCLIFCFFFL